MSDSISDPLDAMFPVVALEDLATETTEDDRWLWDGYLAPGKMTLLTSEWKLGKTTLLSVLLAKMKTGGELAGRTVAPARAAIVTEEPSDYWKARRRRLGIGPGLSLLCQPFRTKPTRGEWQLLIDRLGRLRLQKGFDLLVIDPLATFLPGLDENNAGVMLASLMPLKALTAAGVAVLILHHPSKRPAAEGCAARGSTALSGHVDVLLEMRPHPHGGVDDRRRRLLARSRFSRTPRHVVIELNEEETDYRWLGDLADEVFRSNWEVLRSVLLTATDKLTRVQILEDWPAVEAKPDEATLWRWLERAMAESKVLRKGLGRRSSPFVYWLAEAETRWKKSSFYMGDLPDLEELDGIDADDEPLLPPVLRPKDGSKK